MQSYLLEFQQLFDPYRVLIQFSLQFSHFVLGLIDGFDKGRVNLDSRFVSGKILEQILNVILCRSRSKVLYLCEFIIYRRFEFCAISAVP